MSRGSYGQGKRQRDAEKARKKRDKADRRAMRRDQGPREIEVVSADHMTGALPTADEAIKAMDDRSASGRSAASIPCRLFVGGLSWDTTIESLTEAFTKFGAVVEAVIVKDATRAARAASASWSWRTARTHQRSSTAWTDPNSTAGGSS